MAQLQQLQRKQIETQQRPSSHLNLHNIVNNNTLEGHTNNGGGKERSNTLSQLLEKNRSDRPQQTKAALTMPSSFQRGERGPPSLHSSSAFGSMSSHLPHMPVIKIDFYFLTFFNEMVD
jgi:hypothetical protein